MGNVCKDLWRLICAHSCSACQTDADKHCRERLEAGAAAALVVTYTPTTTGVFACEHFAVQAAGGRQVCLCRIVNPESIAAGFTQLYTAGLTCNCNPQCMV